MKLYDATFVSRLKSGDRHAQKMFFEQLYPMMYRVCSRYMVRQDEAEDCVMKGFMKSLQQIGSFSYTTEESLCAWVRKIMVNEALMALRKTTNFNMMPGDQLPDVAIPAAVWSEFEAEDVERMLLMLPTGYRTVFSLHIVEGYSHHEIAEMLGISESTSKSQLFKARARLKEIVIQTNTGYAKTGG
jgi:RNA polymerase sigma-70 factor (ECF subfamily)